MVKVFVRHSSSSEPRTFIPSNAANLHALVACSRHFGPGGSLEDEEEFVVGDAYVLKEDMVLTWYTAPGAGPSGSGGTFATSAAEVRTVVKEELAEHTSKQDANRAKTKGFSEVSMADVASLFNDLGLVEVDGSSTYPIESPDINQGVDCGEFDFNKVDDTGRRLYANENAGTPACLRHHQEQLEKFGIPFGTGGYKMYDLHSQPSLFFIRAPSGQRYRGGIDGCVAPAGLTETGASQSCRVMYEHKVSDRLNTAASKSQVEVAMLGAYAYNQYPLLADCTDGKVHNLYHVRGNELVVWRNLMPPLAYWKQAQLLADPLLAKRTLRLEAIPEDQQAPVKKLRNQLRGDGSGLREQLDSVVPFLPQEERIGVSMELILAWQQAACQRGMPEAAQSMMA